MSLPTGSTYAVEVQSHTPGVACSVSNGSGTIGASNVTGVVVSCSAGTERILYSFGASATDGSDPIAGVIRDSAGNLYGTTQNGGANGVGTVYKIDSSGAETILHSFGANATDGTTPRAGLTMDRAGNLYGTTAQGGTEGVGTVFKIDPVGSETVVYSFSASATNGILGGGVPYGDLIMDNAGNLYGTTSGGVSGGGGTVFKIDTAGTETTLHSFPWASADDGGVPDGGLILDSAGNLYGTTSQGGIGGVGTVFKIAATGAETILHSFFLGDSDGCVPQGGLILHSAGNLYGTTYGCGSRGGGTVFKIDPAGTETILYSFDAITPSTTDGQNPVAGLIVDSVGNLYGTTAFGGANVRIDSRNFIVGDGTVFKIDPAGKETILHSFGASTTDGLAPFGGLIVDSVGNLYGTTALGGANGGGTVFVID